jgi:hypothetical protein
MPITVDTSTIHLRAASAWVISPAVICKNISHLVSALKIFGRARHCSLGCNGPTTRSPP